jgi:ribosomal protein L19
MEGQYRSSVALRISSATLKCSNITESLNIQPTRCHEKGDLISKRNPQSPVRQESLWILESDLSKLLPMEEHLDQITDLIEQKVDVLRSIASQSTIDVFCGVFLKTSQGGFLLSPELLRKLNLLSVEIIFDLYSSHNDSDEDS